MTDHPPLAMLRGICSRCHDKFDWRALEPLITLHDKIKMLCETCKKIEQPKQSVGCAGDADAK